jgi:nitroimidazol reductase NimA-like FMN-containing flavoprotein (pyridoxamine 5'-phosphate oxidase superfamily)
MTEAQARNAPTPTELNQIVGRRSFCTLATASEKNRPHVAGVTYAAVGMTLYVNTDRSSRKARNVAANPHVGVMIPVRRMPVGFPPGEVQFQGTAEVLAMDDPEIVALVEAGKLKKVTSHGELERPDGCFIRIRPGRKVNTYGVGMSLIQLMRHPLEAAGSVELNGSAGSGQ